MPDPRPAARNAVLALLAVLATTMLTACAGTNEGPSRSPTSPTVRPAVASHDPTTASGAPLVVDPRLLSVLPTSVAGAQMQPAPEAAAYLTTNASLARAASGLAVGTVVAADAKGADFATSTVVQLRPGVYSDGFYADWRTSYDEAACAPAGGVASHARQLVGRHAVEMTVCGGGARTYHTRLDGDILVSITASGDKLFGGLVMAGLRR